MAAAEQSPILLLPIKFCLLGPFTITITITIMPAFDFVSIHYYLEIAFFLVCNFHVEGRWDEISLSVLCILWYDVSDDIVDHELLSYSLCFHFTEQDKKVLTYITRQVHVIFIYNRTNSIYNTVTIVEINEF